MKRLWPVIIALLPLLACQKSEKIYPDFTTSTISAANLWKRITLETNYDDYPEWPGYEGMQIGQSPHGRYHEIYISPALRNALPVKDDVAPPGSIVVKENYDADKNNVGYTVMAKVSGYNPAAGDWFWAQFEPNGKVDLAGKPDYCIKCHEGMKPNDYLIVHRLDAPVAEEEK